MLTRSIDQDRNTGLQSELSNLPAKKNAAFTNPGPVSNAKDEAAVERTELWDDQSDEVDVRRADVRT